MAFQLDYVAPAGFDLAGLSVSFNAPDWKAAEGWARAFLRQVGFDAAGAQLWCDGVTLTLN